MVEGDEPAAAVLLDLARCRVDRRLGQVAARIEAEIAGDLGAALGYALRSPGKRVRPALLLAAYRACQGRQEFVDGLATAVEIVHTYSLIHDDLPCMDNDALRRGRPTTHVQFGLTTATRAGYLLVPVAARELALAAGQLGLGPATTRAVAVELFDAGGIRGMVGGQWLDLEAEGRRLDLSGLIRVHRGKTGALIAASVVIGGLAAGAPPRVIEALRGYGAEIGLAFQVADDVLDATASSGVLGKTAGKDAQVAKSTYVELLGVDRARQEAARYGSMALQSLERAGVDPGDLAPLARYIVNRNS